MSDVLERFLRYVQVDTQSDPNNEKETPSSQIQFDLAHLLESELKALGAKDVEVSKNSYVLAKIDGSEGLEDAPRLGLIAHIDTSYDAPASGVKPQLKKFDGKDIALSDSEDAVKILVSELEDADKLIGKTIVCTDGTTLLGADDKAGVAEIMSLIHRLQEDPSIPHPPPAICFAPDEEIGHGAELLDLDTFSAQYAYTVDGGPIGEFEYESFNAADAKIEIKGTGVHPGSAKNIMVNALQLAFEINQALPAHERPEHTESYEGFYHLLELKGETTHAYMHYIIRDHSKEALEAKKEFLSDIVALINKRHGEGRVKLALKDSYYNMADIVEKHPLLIENAHDAYEKAGYSPITLPIRGGTDGSQLSFRGLPCPNLSTGGYNYHSIREFVPVESLEGMVDVLEQLVRIFAEKN